MAKDNVEKVKAGIEFWDNIPTDEKLFIVFRGTPMIEATIMLISRHSLTHALKAVNHGVVIHAFNEDE